MRDSSDTSEDETWAFELDEVGPDAEPERQPLEPGHISLENAVFVLLGVLGTVALLATSL